MGFGEERTLRTFSMNLKMNFIVAWNFSSSIARAPIDKWLITE